ncbi:MAG: hypothetical protein MN733_38640, partial [Nitrososphaera sp.]|nr:hypothetical protein [Nitrososphaera sp.]
LALISIRELANLLAFRRYGVDNFPHFSYLRRGKTSPVGVLLNRRLVVSNINAKGLIACNIGVLPLNVLFLCPHF